jgi:ribulose 1,5-bisphosphate carboxylase large subunit-like protein
MVNLFTQDFDESKYILATYHLQSRTSLRNAAWELAIGQSIGNPNKRSKWETEELFKNHSCLIIEDEDALAKVTSGPVTIAFPVANIDLETDGISQLLCQVMGGQMDIDDIESCSLEEINFPDQVKQIFKGPKFGLTGMRRIDRCLR